MRKMQKNQLLELVDTLMQTHMELGGQSQDTIQNVLADCQECAMAIGEAIEETEGEGTPAVSFLVRYCELLYQLSISTEDKQGWMRIDSEVKSLLKDVERSIKEDIPLKLEVVFLPYKASMWDSLESIWLAAREDERCDCYVIPIPYFDRNKEGRADTMHYEGDQFPSYVPVTDYAVYNIKERHPDVIYFHNPFDQYNYVTTVHPDYYSEELKKNTDMLVYVSYFICSGGMPESHLGLSGYRYADKIILQNEKMIEGMKKYTPEDKLAVLGSPKIDRMISMEENKPEMPQEWKEFIKGRKVFFYNTSISDLLKDTKKELAKMEDVFTAFLDHKEAALIWRPHPLMRSTFQSMRYDLLQEYDRLERWFIEKQIGILDKTPDVNAVIALSDGYVGDPGSSIVPMFGVTGKAALVCPHGTVEELSSVDFRRLLIEEDEAWFIAARYQAICKLDLKSGEMKVVCTIPETSRECFEYIGIFKYGSKVIARTGKANSLFEYDLETEQFKKYYFKDDVGSDTITFSEVFSYKKNIFFVPMEYEAIIRFDVESGEFIYYYDCISDMRKVAGEPADNEKKPFGWGAAVWKNKLYLASALSNHILIFDMETEAYSINEIGNSNDIFSHIIVGKQYNWLLRSNDAAIIRWKRESNEGEAFNQFPEGYESGEFPYCFVGEYKESVIALPWQANMTIKVNIHTGEMERFPFQMPYKEGEHISEYYKRKEIYRCAIKMSENKIVCFTTYDNSLVLFDLTDGTYKKFQLRLDREYVLNNICNRMKGIYTYLCPEKENHTLDMFIEYVKSDRHDKRQQLKCYQEIAENMGCSGIKIHEYIMGQVL